jgi:hypothetical protein
MLWYVVLSTASSMAVQEIFAMDSLKDEEVGKSDQVVANIIISYLL